MEPAASATQPGGGQPDLFGPHSPFRRLKGRGPAGTLLRLAGFYLALGALLLALRWALGLPHPAAVPLRPSLAGLGWGLAGVAVYVLYNATLPRTVAVLPGGRELLRWLGRRSSVLFSRLPLWTLLVMALAGGGICEEILFRGWLQPVAGLWLTALLFTLAHFPPLAYRWSHPATWGMMGLYFPVCLGIGALFAWRGELFAPMVTHAVSDALGVLRLHYVLGRARRAAAARAQPSPPSAGGPVSSPQTPRGSAVDSPS